MIISNITQLQTYSGIKCDSRGVKTVSRINQDATGNTPTSIIPRSGCKDRKATQKTFEINYLPKSKEVYNDLLEILKLTNTDSFEVSAEKEKVEFVMMRSTSTHIRNEQLHKSSLFSFFEEDRRTTQATQVILIEIYQKCEHTTRNASQSLENIGQKIAVI